MKLYRFTFLLLLVISACGPSAEEQATLTATSTTATAAAWTETPTPSPTSTATKTLTARPVFTATTTPSPTISATATFAFPAATVNKQAHCRYGPSVAYLHAADLFPGDTGTVRERYIYSNWLYVKFDKLNYFCWVAPSVVDVVGDVSALKYKELNLQSIGSNMYGPPRGVTTTRNGAFVVISWEQVEMTRDDDRGYLLELFVCQNGGYIWWTDSYPDQFTTSYEVKDESGCSQPSSGKLYTVEKHGFSEPANIPWPAP
ncbi:MAG: hypothetical protein M3R47_07585 [Chloroflexota bacterium]|nr:hypothetical protein [Chloroflexota bacterium]